MKNKTPEDIPQKLARALEDHWRRVLLRLREEGKITNTTKDIGELFKAVPSDIEKECREEIKEALWTWAWPQLRRSVTKGLPEWYKNLLKQAAAQTACDIHASVGTPDPSSPYANYERSCEIDRAENEGMP